jgi:8-oxo-dGTP diphosphatase
LPLPKTPLLAVDGVVVDRMGRVLLIRRKNPPYKGMLALPGGFVEIGETVEAAARRELAEETGVEAGRLSLVGVYSDPNRDPRGHTCSVAFLTRAKHHKASAGDDAKAVEWLGNFRRVELAFDHRKIIADAFKLMKKIASAPQNR